MIRANKTERKDVMKNLEKALEKLSTPIANAATEGHASWLRGVLNQWQEKVDAENRTGNKCAPENVFGYKDCHTKADYNNARLLRATVRPLLDAKRHSRISDHPLAGQYEYTVKENVDEVIAEISNKEGAIVARNWRIKLMGKLAKPLANCTVTGIAATGELAYNNITMTTSNQVTFTLRSQVVSVWPYNAIPHHRYPTTVHNVIDNYTEETRKRVSIAQLADIIAAADNRPAKKAAKKTSKKAPAKKAKAPKAKKTSKKAKAPKAKKTSKKAAPRSTDESIKKTLKAQRKAAGAAVADVVLDMVAAYPRTIGDVCQTLRLPDGPGRKTPKEFRLLQTKGDQMAVVRCAFERHVTAGRINKTQDNGKWKYQAIED